MPVLANNQMKKQRIVNIIFRFLNSFLPKLTAIDGGKPRGTDTIGEKPPFSGVKKVPNPGGWDEDVQVELTHEEPTPVTVLAMNAETQG
jgi:hypothetical protein